MWLLNSLLESGRDLKILSNKIPPPYSCFFSVGLFFFCLSKIIANTVFSSIFTTYEVGALIFSVP